ncbi:peptidase M24, partial [bacterium]|nr:peptidase M24 [bacterium]
YGHFEIVLEGKEYKEDIGIRIEDDLLVTAKGCLNLSESCPKTIEEMEN